MGGRPNGARIVLNGKRQTRIGNQLTSLETQWQQAIGNNLQLTMANAAMEAETHRLRMREQELSGMLYHK